MNSCQFLNVAKCQNLFASGKAIQGERVFRDLKRKAQIQIQGRLTRLENPSLYFRRALLGSVFPSLCTGLDEKVSQIWKESSSEKKARVIEEFMDVRVTSKLEKELRDAQYQMFSETPIFHFDIASTQFPILPFAPVAQTVRGFQWVFTSLCKICFFPWGIYSLYRSFKEKDLFSLPVGIAHLQGRRGSMEDEHLVTEFICRLGQKKSKVSLFGIFDGHGGDSAAKFSKLYFADYLKEALEKHASIKQSDARIFMAFKEACLNLDSAYTGKAGSTLSVAVILGEDLWVCNLGDSRIIGNVKGVAVQLSEDQKCDNEKYVKGVKKRGGEIQHLRVINRQNHIALAVPRALGDHVMRKENGADPIIHAPKITKVPLSFLQEGHLIIGCDGLWDESTSGQVAAFVENHKETMTEEELARALVAKAYNAGSSDNISVLVVNLANR